MGCGLPGFRCAGGYGSGEFHALRCSSSNADCLAHSRQDTMLRSFGHMSMQLETGIDESAANFRLTKDSCTCNASDVPAQHHRHGCLKEWRSLERYVHQPTGRA